MSTILLLGSQHGDELLGDKLYDYLQRKHPKLLGKVSFLLANPRAHKANVRFIEADMNRSYVNNPANYEQRRARIVKKYIEQRNSDLVLDLHTTTVKQADCVIVANINDCNRAILGLLPIKNVVVMKHPIVTTSLNAQFAHIVSIEISRVRLTESLYEGICLALKKFLAGHKGRAPKYIFTVNTLLAKSEYSEEQIRHMKNFKLFGNTFYPVLVGENSYKKNTDYLGFKADSMQEIKL